MASTIEAHSSVEIPSFDGTVLRGRHWPGTQAQGILLISHGLGEHCGCYGEFARAMTVPDGLVDVVGFDYRGHGLSPGKRGVVRAYEDLVRDLRAAVVWVHQTWPDRPLFLLGHSNGGQVALRAILAGETGLAGLILSNPSIRLAYPAPGWKLAIGHVLRYVAPWMTLTSELVHQHMTRDSASWPVRASDPLRHTRLSAPLFFGMIEGGPRILERAGEIRLPTLMVLGGSDNVIDPSAGELLFQRLGSPDKTLVPFHDMLHEPLNEIGREHVYTAIIDWLTARLGSALAQGPVPETSQRVTTGSNPPTASTFPSGE
jgi:alpha-beta hydrolase superfamily lysophospholipase